MRSRTRFAFLQLGALTTLSMSVLVLGACVKEPVEWRGDARQIVMPTLGEDLSVPPAPNAHLVLREVGSPVLESLALEWAGRVRIAKLNVDENPRTAQQYNVSSIPAMMIFKDGKKVDELIGLAPKQAIAASLQKAI